MAEDSKANKKEWKNGFMKRNVSMKLQRIIARIAVEV